MEQNKSKFRIRLNLFDSIVLLLVLAVGAFVAWNALKPAPAADEPAAASSAIRYTVRFQRLLEGTGSLIQEGDALVDTIKNYQLGRVVSTQIVPAQTLVLDQDAGRHVLADLPGYEDVLVTVEGVCTDSGTELLLDGGFTLRVGKTAYVRGAGYMGSGPVISIEREGQTA